MEEGEEEKQIERHGAYEYVYMYGYGWKRKNRYRDTERMNTHIYVRIRYVSVEIGLQKGTAIPRRLTRHGNG